MIGVVAAALLTGGDTDTPTDQMIVAAAFCLFVGLCVVALLFAGKGGRWLADANETAMLLRESILKTAPATCGMFPSITTLPSARSYTDIPTATADTTCIRNWTGIGS